MQNESQINNDGLGDSSVIFSMEPFVNSTEKSRTKSKSHLKIDSHSLEDSLETIYQSASITLQTVNRYKLQLELVSSNLHVQLLLSNADQNDPQKSFGDDTNLLQMEPVMRKKLEEEKIKVNQALQKAKIIALKSETVYKANTKTVQKVQQILNNLEAMQDDIEVIVQKAREVSSSFMSRIPYPQRYIEKQNDDKKQKIISRAEATEESINKYDLKSQESGGLSSKSHKMHPQAKFNILTNSCSSSRISDKNRFCYKNWPPSVFQEPLPSEEQEKPSPYQSIEQISTKRSQLYEDTNVAQNHLYSVQQMPSKDGSKMTKDESKNSSMMEHLQLMENDRKVEQNFRQEMSLQRKDDESFKLNQMLSADSIQSVQQKRFLTISSVGSKDNQKPSSYNNKFNIDQMSLSDFSLRQDNQEKVVSNRSANESKQMNFQNGLSKESSQKNRQQNQFSPKEYQKDVKCFTMQHFDALNSQGITPSSQNGKNQSSYSNKPQFRFSRSRTTSATESGDRTSLKNSVNPKTKRNLYQQAISQNFTTKQKNNSKSQRNNAESDKNGDQNGSDYRSRQSDGNNRQTEIVYPIADSNFVGSKKHDKYSMSLAMSDNTIEDYLANNDDNYDQRQPISKKSSNDTLTRYEKNLRTKKDSHGSVYSKNCQLKRYNRNQNERYVSEDRPFEEENYSKKKFIQVCFRPSQDYKATSESYEEVYHTDKSIQVSLHSLHDQNKNHQHDDDDERNGKNKRSQQCRRVQKYSLKKIQHKQQVYEKCPPPTTNKGRRRKSSTYQDQGRQRPCKNRDRREQQGGQNAHNCNTLIIPSRSDEEEPRRGKTYVKQQLQKNLNNPRSDRKRIEDNHEIPDKNFPELSLARINKLKPIPCDREVFLYKLNTTKLRVTKPDQLTPGECLTDNCDRPFSISKVTKSNLVLIAVQNLCPCNAKKISVETSPVDYQGNKHCKMLLMNRYRKRPACSKYHYNERNIEDGCGGCNTLPCLSILVVLLTQSFVVFLRKAFY